MGFRQVNENKKYIEREDEYDMDGYDFQKSRPIFCYEQRLVEPAMELREQVQTMQTLIANLYKSIGKSVQEDESEEDTILSDNEWIQKACALVEEVKVVKQQVAKYQKTSELTEEITQYLNSLNIQLPGMQKQIAVVSSLLQRKE